jgi:hypothetical protein
MSSWGRPALSASGALIEVSKALRMTPSQDKGDRLNTLNNPNTPDGLAMSTLVFMRPGLNTLNNPNTSAGPFQKMSEEEDKEIEKRREAAGTSNVETVGVALSGGGIRSATFCLGVFQALAEHGLLGKIDYLSTVSGGGYFGSFLGRLFTRAWVDPKTV